MFERYTEKARRVIFFARYEASQFGAPAIEPEHLLLGLMREDKTLTSRFFSRAQAQLEAVRREIEGRTFQREKSSVSVELPLAPETKRVLAYAHEESERLQHRHIGTEHLLLGLLREDRSMAAEILYERGLRLSAVREQVARETGSETGTDAQPVPTPWIEEIRAHGYGLVSIANRMSRFYGIYAETSASGALDHLVTMAEQRINPAQVQKGGRMEGKEGRRTKLGLEKLLEERLELVRGARVGLVCNQASVDHSLRHAADILRERSEFRLTTLFGPQHGIRGDVQDNMIETEHMLDSATGVPIYSLYSETREPTERMLEGLDTLVFDMQDVGCRIYTFIYTLANCMRAAKKYGKRVVVCDRPNPITGKFVAGNVLEPEYASFVGQFPIPTRHGMTVAELARMFNEHFQIGCELEVLTMDGWSREQWMDETDAPWVIPSPNMPTPQTATVFPGTVHVEGTHLSEGRGTTLPFELVGAPYIDSEEYAKQLTLIGFAGTHFRACGFQPTFQKHAGRTCGGVQIHVTDREAFEPVTVGVATVKVAYDLYGEQFGWKEPPYEYVYDKNPFDVIAGTDKLRAQIERGESMDTIKDSWNAGLEAFKAARSQYLLY